jgi:competence protein CoiA
MKFAVVNGKRQEPQPGLEGQCPSCGRPMVAKCGEVRVAHWAHKGHRACDLWWENETEWHRVWKDQFPVDWQEVPHRAEDGERHIADVKTHDGWFIEFQHSHIGSDERLAREGFYQSLIWVVDGIRRERDVFQFSKAWANGESRDPLSSKRRISSPGGALLRDWGGSRAHVLFDFGHGRLWWLFPESDNVRAYVHDQFVRIHREKHARGPSAFESLVENFSAFIAHYESPPRAPQPRRSTEIPSPPNRRLIQRSYRL